jgi:hypothetical protein
MLKVILAMTMLSIVSTLSHANHPSGCVVVQEKPESREVLFDTIEKCRAEVQKLIHEDSGWSGFIDDSQNKTSIEIYNLGGFGNTYPIFINRK